MTSFDVTLDANVLVPIDLCDILLRLAQAAFYRPHWSAETLREVQRTIIKLGVPEDRARKRVADMAEAFPEALVEHADLILEAMPNDPKDRHVLAAAVLSGSQLIVTSNLKHFPQEHLAPFSIEAQAPDQFLIHQSTLDPQTTVETVRQLAADRVNPSMSIDQVLDRLSKSAPEFTQAMRSHLAPAAETSSVRTWRASHAFPRETSARDPQP